MGEENKGFKLGKKGTKKRYLVAAGFNFLLAMICLFGNIAYFIMYGFLIISLYNLLRATFAKK